MSGPSIGTGGGGGGAFGIARSEATAFVDDDEPRKETSSTEPNPFVSSSCRSVASEASSPASISASVSVSEASSSFGVVMMSASFTEASSRVSPKAPANASAETEKSASAQDAFSSPDVDAPSPPSPSTTSPKTTVEDAAPVSASRGDASAASREPSSASRGASRASRGASSSSASTTSPKTSSAASSSASSSASAENTDDVATSSSAPSDGNVSSAFPSASIASTRTTSAPVSIGTSAESVSEREAARTSLRSSLRSADSSDVGNAGATRERSVASAAFETCSCDPFKRASSSETRVCARASVIVPIGTLRTTVSETGARVAAGAAGAARNLISSPSREVASFDVRRSSNDRAVRSNASPSGRVSHASTDTAPEPPPLKMPNELSVTTAATRHASTPRRLHAARDRVHLRLPFAGRAGDTPLVSAGLLGGEPRREPLRFDSDGFAGPGCQFSSSPPQSSSAPHELCGR